MPINENELLSKNEDEIKVYHDTKDLSELIDQIESVQETNTPYTKSIIAQELDRMHSADIAALLNIVNTSTREYILEILTNKQFNEKIFFNLANTIKEEIIEYLGIQKTSEILLKLDTDDLIYVLVNMDNSILEELQDNFPEEIRKNIYLSLSHDENTAGRFISNRFVAIAKSWTVNQTLNHIKNSKVKYNELYYIYIIENNIPIGFIKLTHLLQASEKTKIADIMSPLVVSISADTDQEEVALLFKKYHLSSAPIVNKSNQIIGSIDIDDIIDVIYQEAEEDILHLGGVGVSETDLYSNIIDTFAKRVPWLFVNLITAGIAASVINLFHESIEKLIPLAVILPIIASMSGNSGIQAVTVTVRAIATQELTSTNYFRIMLKEYIISSLNALTFAIILSVIIYLMYDIQLLSYLTLAATFIAVSISGFMGTMIPITLYKLKLDPAIASPIFLTTTTDVISFGSLLYLSYLYV